MTRSLISFSTLLMSIVVCMEDFLGACAEHNTYHVNDGYHRDRHEWDDREQSYYLQWENDPIATTRNGAPTSKRITGNGATARRTKFMTTVNCQQSTPAALGF